MFDKNSWWKSLRDRLRDREGDDVNELGGLEHLLFRVELGLRLLERLELLDEPISILWAVQANPYVPHRALARLDQAQRAELDRCRLLTGFTGRFDWERSLRAYARLPEQFRAYRITEKPLDEQLILQCRIAGQREEHVQEYDRLLISPLTPRFMGIPSAKPGTVTFSTRSRKGVELQLRATLTEEVVRHCQENLDCELDPIQRGVREGRVLSADRLREIARYLDQRASEVGLAPSYVARLPRLKSLFSDDSLDLVLDGFVNLPGPVGSGKSTLSELLAACAISEGWRVVLVLGDVMSVLDAADRINRLLASDDQPVAVPILGRSTLDKNAERFYARKPVPGHWGERWLQTQCPLLGMVELEQLFQFEESPVPGREPCQHLRQANPDTHSDRHLCPMFAACPSQQAYRDLSRAPVWITTPGALTASNIPLQLDQRHLKVGELIYERADLVIFDEADSVAAWLDDVFAPMIALHGSPGAILDRADGAGSRPLQARILTSEEERWLKAERVALIDLNSIMRQLHASQHSRLLTSWIGRGFFTAYSLFNRIARLLCGLEEMAEPEETDDKGLVDQIMSWFEPLVERDLLGESQLEQEPANELYTIARLVQGGNFNDIVEHCEKWIEKRETECEWDLDTLLADINASRRVHIETRQTLATRIAFTVYIALLDRNIRIVLYEWDNQPDETRLELGDPPHRVRPGLALDIIPIPPIGRLFGTYYLTHDDNEDRGGVLGRLEYTNMGRWYLHNYHRWLADLGIPGPHVLAMSGTGWLPDSLRWHIPHEPYGILLAQPPATSTGKGTFSFAPVYDAGGQAIRVSGRRDEMSVALLQLVDELVKRRRLQDELSSLEALGAEFPSEWEDRARLLLLVNSYDQAKLVADQLRRKLPDYRIDHLARVEDDESSEEQTGLLRADVEGFGRGGGQILVAPMNAIGRGYNILNGAGKAGIGSVFFLIRPMQHPGDIQAMAGEMNAQTLAWMAQPDHPIWANNSRFVDAVIAFRQEGHTYWRSIEERRGYASLSSDARRSLAATTLGYIVQACGRLLRGGVPFRAHFVDAAWAPESAIEQPDTPRTSLLVALLSILRKYLVEEPGTSLYAQFAGLLETENLLFDASEDW